MTINLAAALPSAALPWGSIARRFALVMLAIGAAGSHSARAAEAGGIWYPPGPYLAQYPAAPYPSYGAAQPTVVPLIPHGRNFTVPGVINGAVRLELLIDSGSTDMVLPAQAVLVMLRTGALTENDFIGHAGYRLADGSVLVSPRFNLRQVQVGNRVVYNVTASVGEVEGLPLLGQSFLSRFASWAIDNNRHALILTGP
jgi:hypothetical protein